MSAIVWQLTEEDEDLYIKLDKKYGAFEKYFNGIPKVYPKVILKAIKGVGWHFEQTGMAFPEDIYESGDEPSDLVEAGSEGYEDALCLLLTSIRFFLPCHRQCLSSKNEKKICLMPGMKK